MNNCECGHDKSFHHTLGGLTKCAALVKRVPKTFCDCTKFEEVME